MYLELLVASHPELASARFGFLKLGLDSGGRRSSSVGVSREQDYMQMVLCTLVVVNYWSNSSLEAGIADEHSGVLPIKRFHGTEGFLCVFYGVCVLAEVFCADNLKIQKFIKQLASWIPIAINMTFIL